MIRSRSFALVDTESKVSACTHMPIVRYEDARFSKRDDSVIQEAELTVFVNGARQCDTTCSPWDVRELVAGNLFLAGVVTDPEQVSAIDVDLDSGAVSVRVDVAGASRRRRRHVETLRDGGVVISGVFERGDGGDPSCDAEGFLPVESDLTLQAAQVVERMALLEDPLAAVSAHGRRAQRGSGRPVRGGCMVRGYRAPQCFGQAGRLVLLERGGCVG